jgi:hypothetical protein
VPLIGWFIVVTYGAPAATGASLIGVTVTETTATFELEVPSLALNVKLSAPFASGLGT